MPGSSATRACCAPSGNCDVANLPRPSAQPRPGHLVCRDTEPLLALDVPFSANLEAVKA